jgi:hypothetical protein
MRPDAVFLTAVSAAMAGRIFERVAAVCQIAEPLLQVNYAAGERAYIRKQPGGRLFITRDPTDTILYPTGHPRSGSPRYRWERQTDGTELGWLNDD